MPMLLRLLHMGRLSFIIVAMAKTKQQPPASFEEGVQELEKILSEIESGNIGLEESLARYERGTFLLQYCRGILTQAEEQIQEIGKSTDGSLTATPLEDAPK